MFYKEIALYHEGHHHDHDHVHTDCGCGCHTHEEDMSKDEKTLKGGTHKKEKIGRNDPCPCGSGKKYKKCCGRN